MGILGVVVGVVGVVIRAWRGLGSARGDLGGRGSKDRLRKIDGKFLGEGVCRSGGYIKGRREAINKTV